MAKKAAKKGSKPSLKEINKKLDLILKEQRTLGKEEEKIEKEEEKVEKEEEAGLREEEKVEELGKEESSELEKLESMEQEIKKRVAPHPLKRITIKDLARGSIGALFGAVAHYTFLYGVEVANKLSFSRAVFLFAFSFFVGAVFLYVTGFRKIKDPRVLIFLPVRLVVLYLTAVVMAILVLLFFQPGFGHTFEEGFKQVSAVTLTSIIGACTADLIGKD